MSNYLLAQDVISGAEGRAYITSADGNNELIFFAKEIESEVEIEEIDIKVIGSRTTQKKDVGWTGTLKMTVYYSTSMFRDMVLTYIKTGKSTYFDVVVVNDDPNSSIGIQTVVHKNCKINKSSLSKLIADAEGLEEEIECSFTDVDILDKFGKPAQLGGE